ncbi:ABC transporter substrate-binding protein [Paenibacillus humicola]|uniref:ABC transporter substrate-binding protein n=1 Tax=Paenibacillus humicola TaxID=3110540 RepID=UPI00237ABD47|nr:sugar ABC transporter substrate-binding protein [Paenibacillus humicola]
MNKRKHRMLVKGGVLLAAAALALTGCSSGGKSGAQTGDSGEGSGNSGAKGAKLSIMWWGADDRHQATLKALDLYTEQHPEISFTPEYLSWDGYWSKLTTLAASKSMTDVLQMDGAYIQDYASRGTLEDLSDIDFSGIIDQKIIDSVKIGGKLYGVPLSLNGQGYAFNKADLAAAGVTLPHKDWTWDDFWNFAKEARQKLPKDKYPISDASNGWDSYQYYQTAMGKGPVISPDGKKLNIDKDLWYTFNNMYAQFRKDGVVPSPDEQGAFVENDPKADPMASGKVMTRGATVASVSVLETLMPGKVGVVNIPVGPAGGGWAQPTIFLSVSANSKHKEEAKAFLKWFVSDKEAGQTLGLTRGIPVNDTIYKELEPNLQPKDKIGKELMDVVSDKALPFYPAPPGWSEWVQAYQNEMDAVRYGQETLDQAYNNIVKLGQDTAAKQGG